MRPLATPQVIALVRFLDHVQTRTTILPEPTLEVLALRDNHRLPADFDSRSRRADAAEVQAQIAEIQRSCGVQAL